MTQGIQHVCVVGAGIAGLACALAAAVRGLRVDLFEKKQAPEAIRAHVEVVPSMLRDLVVLGVGDDCVRAGFAYHGTDIVDRQGRALDQLPTERVAGARYPSALGIGYAELHRVLECAAVARGVNLHRGAAVAGVEPQAERATLRLGNGEGVSTDLVLLATGASARLRTKLFPHAKPTEPLGQAWWYTLLPRPIDLDRPCIVIGGAGRKALLVPVRGDVAGLALVEPSPDASLLLTEEPAVHLRSAFDSFSGRVRVLLKQLGEDATFVLRPTRSGLLPAPWFRNGVLAVGDCAHAMPPHFGQAAAQAIEDAVVFGDLLTVAPDRSALGAMFTERRVPRVGRVHELTTRAARWDVKPESATDMRDLMQSLARTVAQPA